MFGCDDSTPSAFLKEETSREPVRIFRWNKRALPRKVESKITRIGFEIWSRWTGLRENLPFTHLQQEFKWGSAQFDEAHDVDRHLQELMYVRGNAVVELVMRRFLVHTKNSATHFQLFCDTPHNFTECLSHMLNEQMVLVRIFEMNFPMCSSETRKFNSNVKLNAKILNTIKYKNIQYVHWTVSCWSVVDSAYKSDLLYW